MREAWKRYDEAKTSENDDPWAVLPRNQLFLLLQMSNCGSDLDSQSLSVAESVHVLKTVTHNIAQAEAACQFEHRDLHSGNILIKRDVTGMPVPTIIDFTLSR